MNFFLSSRILCSGLLIFMLSSVLLADLKTGADRFCIAPHKYIKGKRVAVLCHKASVVARGKHTEHLLDALLRASKKKNKGFEIVALFSPGGLIDSIGDATALSESAVYAKIACPVYSCSPSGLSDAKKHVLTQTDLIIIDLQDVGMRSYSYLPAMLAMLKVAAEAQIPVILLDRPNPIKEWGAAGSDFEQADDSLIAKIGIPFMHGMTLGEIARKAAPVIGGKVTVIEAKGSQAEAFRYLRHHFVAPSPDLPTLKSQFFYPITTTLLATNYNEGRGTEHPFELFGAPWVDGDLLAEALNKQELPGVVFEALRFTPKSLPHCPNPKYADKECGGVMIKLTDRSAVKPLVVSQKILITLFRLYPLQSRWLASKRSNYIIDQMMASPSWRLSVEAARKG